MDLSPESLARDIDRLATFPDVAFRINEMVASENSGAAEIGALIEPDPALSAALLRIANSAMYSVGGTVSTVDRAVTVVGLREVRDLAFGICATNTFDGIGNDLITVEDFWKHSLFCAAAAQEVGRRAKLRGGDSLFTAGLLHDIGHLVMFNRCPDLSAEALSRSLEDNDGLTPYHSEREVFGFDHMAVGSALAELWRLPESLRNCIAWHHEPLSAPEDNGAACAVHVANSVAVLAELDSRDWNEAPPVDDDALERLGTDRAALLDGVEAARNSALELLRVFVH